MGAKPFLRPGYSPIPDAQFEVRNIAMARSVLRIEYKAVLMNETPAQLRSDVKRAKLRTYHPVNLLHSASP